VNVTVPRKQWDTYFAQMREFAEANDLKIRVARLKPDQDVFFVDLWRADVALIGGNFPDAPEFVAGVYIDPSKGGSIEMADALVERMKVSLAKVPGITVKQTK